MTVEECTEILAPFVLALRADFDEPTFRAYHRFLKDVPAALLIAALEAEQDRGDLRFMPNAPELRAKCELQRRALLALQPWTPCVDCADSPRWRPVLVDGIPRVERCPCVERHRLWLADKGIAEPICALPGTASEGPAEQDYPTRAQLPATLQARLSGLVDAKALR